MSIALLRANAQDTGENVEDAVTDSTHVNTYKTVPVQLTFIYPMGTNGFQAAKIPVNLSINILAGMSGGVEGLEVGSLVNFANGDVTGVQAAGLANFSTGNIIGIQASGLASGSLGTLRGVQFSGLTSFNKGYMVGMQVSGLANVNTDSVAGVQFAGLVNVTTRNMAGLMASGISNTTVGNFNGAQLSGILNVTTQELNGVQIGLMNYARTINGFQLGLVNIAHSADKGAALGLFTYIRTGYHKFEVESNETFYLNTTFKSGVERLYMIYTIGFKTKGDKAYWAPGFGIGTYFTLSEKLSMNTDLIARQVNEDEWWTKDLNMLNTLKVNVAYQLSEKVQLYGGPSLNVAISGIEDNEGNIIGESFTPSWAFYSKTYDHKQVKMYLGFNAGIRF